MFQKACDRHQSTRSDQEQEKTHLIRKNLHRSILTSRNILILILWATSIYNIVQLYLLFSSFPLLLHLYLFFHNRAVWASTIQLVRRWEKKGERWCGATCLKRGGTLQPQACMRPSSRRMCSRTCRYCSRRCSLRTDSAESLRRDATPLLGSLWNRKTEKGRDRGGERSAKEHQRASQPASRVCKKW